jgi:hypothetical protein
VEGRAVEEALVGERLERPAGLGGALGVERDLEVAAVGRNRGDVGLGGIELRLRLLEVALPLGLRLLGRLAAGRGGLLCRRRGGRGLVARVLVVPAAGGDQQREGEQQRDDPEGRR